MRQRIVIAMAMACEPRLLIADEPTTALDVTIQAEILALIDRLKRENGMAVLFITHDMAVVAQMADRVVVMYRGKIVEEGPVARDLRKPASRLYEDAARRRAEARRNARHDRARADANAGRDAPAVALDDTAASNSANPEVLLDVKNLTTRFPVKGGVLRRTVANVHAVEDVSFSINVGETLSLSANPAAANPPAGARSSGWSNRKAEKSG